MATKTPKDADRDPIEPLIDDLIRQMLDNSSISSTSTTKGTMTSMIETIMASSTRTSSKESMIDRLVFTQSLAVALADSLAPALAEALAPEIVKALDRRTAHPTHESGRGGSSSQAKGGGGGKSAETT